MKTIRSLVAAAFALLAPSLSAATIAWSTSAVTGPGDVRLDGALVGAMNVGTTSADGVPTQVVNGVPFESEPGGAGALALGSATVQFSFANNLFNDFWVIAAPGGSAEYDRALDYGRTQDGGTRSGTVTLGGLVVGRTYLVQLWVADRRGCCDSRDRTVDGVATNAAEANIVTGSFTADAASQVITIVGVGGTDHGPQVNMLQLRETARPPLVVTSAGNADAGSLRAALAAAAAQGGADTIVFDAALNGKTLTLESVFDIADASPVSIDASALPGGFTISGNNATRHFQVAAGKSLTLRGLTLNRGFGSGDGGSIYNAGTLALDRCTLTGNTSAFDGGALGSPGSFTAVDSTFSNNTAARNGGGIHTSGDTVALTRCTLHGNTADAGGAIWQEDASSTTTLSHCTISGNRGSTGGIAVLAGDLSLLHCTVSQNVGNGGGGGFYIQDPATVNVQSSIIAGNTALTGPDIFLFSGTINPSGVNLIGNNASVETQFPAVANLVGTAAAPLNPKLSPLGSFGGPVQTMHPLVGSPAIDAAGSTDPGGTDARGFPRFVDGTSIGFGARLDIGAVEAGRPFFISEAGDAATGANFRNAMAFAPIAGQGARIVVLPGVSPIVLTRGELVPPADFALFIDSSALPGGLTISGNNASRVFTIPATSTVAMHSVKIVDGNIEGDGGGGGGGGGIFNFGTITLAGCTISNNHARGGSGGVGGAIYNGIGRAILTRCTLSNNFASSEGGAIYSTTASLMLTQCTVSGNRSGGSGAIINVNGQAVLTHCTLSGNTADEGRASGLASYGNNVTKTVVQNCIISDNANSSVEFVFGSTNSFTSLGGNLIGIGNATGRFNVAGDILSDAPQLVPLGNNGGPTQTMALRPTSPAIDAAVASTRTTDQRGFPIDSLPDIGAFEFAPTAPTAPNGTATATTGDQATITLPPFDVDGDPVVITAVTPSAGITVNSTSGLDVTFTPATNFVGVATLGYTVANFGPTLSGQVIISVADNDAPSISAPGGGFTPLIFYSGPMPDYRGQAVKSDNIGTPTVTQSPQPGITIIGSTILPVTLTATDSAGNTATTTFGVALRPAAPVHTTHLAVDGANTPLAPGAGTNGLPADAKLTSFGPPATDDAGDVAFVAKWKSATSKGTALFLNDKCLAIVGGASPVAGAKYVRFTDPVVDRGKVLCIAKLSNGASAVVSNFTGAALEKIALTGEVAAIAGGGDGKYKSFKTVALRGGSLCILGKLTGGTGANRITAANDDIVWVRDSGAALLSVWRDGLDFGNGVKNSFVTFQPGIGSPGQGRWFSHSDRGFVLTLNTLTDKSKAIYASSTNGDILFASTGEVGTNAAPALAGASFASFRYPAMNDALQTTFFATMKVGAGGVTKANASGIFLGDADFVSGSLAPYELIARIGTGTGFDTGVFTKLSDPVLSQNGGVAFTATQKGTGIKGLTTKTLWWKPAGQELGLLALGGNPAGDVPDSQWKSFDSLAITDRGPLFAATLVAGKGGVTSKTASGVWACDFTGNPRKLFRLGDTINGKKLAKFTLLKVTVGNLGVTRSFNNAAQVVWLAEFTDKSSAIIVTEVP